MYSKGVSGGDNRVCIFTAVVHELEPKFVTNGKGESVTDNGILNTHYSSLDKGDGCNPVVDTLVVNGLINLALAASKFKACSLRLHIIENDGLPVFGKG